MATGYAVPDRLAKATRGEQLTYTWLCDALPDEFDVCTSRGSAAASRTSSCSAQTLDSRPQVKDWSADAIVG